MRPMLFAILAVVAIFPTLSAAKKQTICLNMIVKDEAPVIKRCLDSVRPAIDYWVIVDTGSTDGTQAIIRDVLRDIPGVLYERPWVNFGVNRSEAFKLAKGKADYILFMDADDTLSFEGPATFPFLTKDLYNMWRGTTNFTYQKPQLARGNLPWEWVGVTHEYLQCEGTQTSDILTNVRYLSGDGGASSRDPKKFLKNVALLEEGLKQEPNNTRYAFYLAESYRDAGEKGKAIECFQKRVAMGGWDQEVFWSKLQIAVLLQTLGLPTPLIVEAYKDAHTYRPQRVEPVYYLVQYFNRHGEHAKAYDLIQHWNMLPKATTKDALFNHDWMDQYGMQCELSICAYYVGKYQVALDACNGLLAMKSLPDGWKSQIEANRTWSSTALAKATSGP